MPDDDTETLPPVIRATDRLGRVRRLPPHTRYLTAFGETLHMSEWSRRTGVGVPTIIRRLASGWPVERAVTASDGRVVHQQSPRGRPSPEYRVWASMIQRCTNPATKGYASYGARGIRVCTAWVAFGAFLRDVGPRPAGTTLDRIDGGGHYEPGNVRWATPKQQRDNAGNTHWVEFNGRRRTRADWARAIGLTYTALRQRLDSGWPVEAALTLPKGSRRPS
jgi:hypothetical protein